MGKATLILALATLSALTASACTSTSSPQKRATPRSPTPHTSASPEPPNSVLTGPRGTTADIDGDGRPDEVTAFWQRRASFGGGYRGVVLLKVAFAAGGSATLPVPVRYWYDGEADQRPTVPPPGAWQLDGLPGEEIVIVVDDGPASFASYRVVTDHGSGLALLPAPGPRMGEVPGAWWVGGTVGTGGHGFDCAGRRVVEVQSGPHRTMTSGVREVRTSYVWRRGAWQRDSRILVRHAHTRRSDICPPWRSLY